MKTLVKRPIFAVMAIILLCLSSTSAVAAAHAGGNADNTSNIISPRDVREVSDADEVDAADDADSAEDADIADSIGDTETVGTAANAGKARNIGRGVSVKIPPEIIYQRSSEAVFLLETFDAEGESIRTGSGFFISDTAMAVTNLHVIDGAASATITLVNGESYPVLGVYGTSFDFNIAVIGMEYEGIDVKYLEFADSDLIETGNTVYTIGNPVGYNNTMTAGIIGKTERLLNGETLIQFTAPISFGSGGSPLLDTRGLVVGVTSSSFSYGQNLNLAVPINRVMELELGECLPLESLIVE